jgi:thiamine kinase-like enzyme
MTMTTRILRVKGKMLEHLFDQSWEISSAGGATGEAYIAKHDGQKLFLKRNSSPFLAVLSAEGIVPKLVWTKRIENGDVISAQHWLNGRELTSSEMQEERVTSLLNKIHSSKALLNMLTRLGKEPEKPESILEKLHNTIDADIFALPIIQKSLHYLHAHLPTLRLEDYVVCHGDVNHNNWLLSDDQQLYLIDWDGPMIADPALDLGALLHWYIPEAEWGNWLHSYGILHTEELNQRLRWYVVAQTLDSILWHKVKSRFREMNDWIHFLHSLTFINK